MVRDGFLTVKAAIVAVAIIVVLFVSIGCGMVACSTSGANYYPVTHHSHQTTIHVSKHGHIKIKSHR